MTKTIITFLWFIGVLSNIVCAETTPLAGWDLSPPNWTDKVLTSNERNQVGHASRSPEFEEQWLRMTSNQVITLEVPPEWPTQAFSIETSVRLVDGMQSGAILSYQGELLRWELQYVDQHFLFRANTDASSVTSTSESSFENGNDYHLVVTHDGRMLKVYVNGELASVPQPTGNTFVHSGKASLILGGHQDLSFEGSFREVNLYRHSLPEIEVLERARKQITPADDKEFRFAVRPSLQFKTPTIAKLSWETEVSGDAAVFFGRTRNLGTLIKADPLNAKQEVTLPDLEPNTIYYYKIGLMNNGLREFSKTYEFNTAMNFTLPLVANTKGTRLESADRILRLTGIHKGYAIIESAEEERVALALELARQSDLMIYLFDNHSDLVNAARRALMQEGVYGSRITVSLVPNLQNLSLTEAFASLVIISGGETSDTSGWQKYVQPARGALVSLDPATITPMGWRTLDEKEGLSIAFRPPLKDRGSWSHQYGDPGNTASSGESLGGAKSTEDLVVQWIGHPGADFGIDRQSRMPAPLAVNGRLFHQGMNRLAALDAYSGAVLWTLEAPDLRRLNMPRDSANGCADDDHLYVAIRERAWMMNAQTGQRIHTFQPPDASAGHDWGYLAVFEGTLFGTSVRPNSVYTDFWGDDQWFDEKSGPGTGKVCSENLFAYDTTSGQALWRYDKGLIINSSIAIGGGKVFFVESRNPEVQANRSRQVTSEQLWKDQYLVALDVETGQRLWDQPIDTEDGVITFYLQYHPKAVMVTASNTEYHFYAFDPENGSLLWQKDNPWPDDHHSGFIQHPVIVNDTIFLQPNGYAISSGAVMTTNVGERSGCHTYIGTTGALIYRGKDREIAMWDQESEQVTTWSRLRPSCWLSFIAADGLLLVPEGGGGCSCGGWMETSLGFAPRSLAGLARKEPQPSVPTHD